MNFLLADEINRAPAKVQSALLEVMAEHQVTIGGITHLVPEPFLVMATMNPIESEGVYQLPDAQRDRFLMKVVLDYPSHHEEISIVERMAVRAPEAAQVLSLDGLKRLQERADAVAVEHSVIRYAVDLVHATRDPARHQLADLVPYIAVGVSPRASIGLVRAAKALAVVRGRTYATPQDVFEVAPEVMRHRIGTELRGAGPRRERRAGAPAHPCHGAGGVRPATSVVAQRPRGAGMTAPAATGAWPGPPEAQIAETLRRLELTVTAETRRAPPRPAPGADTRPRQRARREPAVSSIGDDVRRIDWNVTARTRELYVRELIADRDLEAWLVVDASPSMAFGTDVAEKRSIALGAAAAVGFLTARSQNKIGAVVGAGSERRSYPPRQGQNHLRGMLTAIAQAPAGDGRGRTDLGALLDDVAGRARRRGFVCVISDFLADPEQWRRPLGSLALRHEVLAIEIVDRRELELPAVGTITLTDPANGRSREIRLTADVRRRYAAAAADQRARIRSTALAAGSQHVQLSTNGAWLEDLIHFVHRRRHLANRSFKAAGALK